MCWGRAPASGSPAWPTKGFTPASLQLMPHHPPDQLLEPLSDGPAAPLFERHRLRAGTVLGKDPSLLPREPPIEDVDVGFIIEPEGTVIEVGGSHRDPAVVDHHHLGVIECRLVLVD